MNAQNTVQQDSVINAIVTTACEELAKPEWNEKTPEQLNRDLQFYFGMQMFGNMPSFEKYFDTKIGDTDKMDKIGEQLGLKLVSDCPVFMALSLKASPEGALQEEMDGEGFEEEVYEFPEMKGTFLAVTGKDFATIEIKGDDGKKYAFLWFAQFEGSELLETDLKALKGKRVSIEYNEFEHYVPSKKSYQVIKEMASIKIIE